MSNNTNKRKKSWYRKQAFLNKRKKIGHYLAPGLKGFIITCNEHEKEAVREAYNILNEYADKLYGPEEVKMVLRFASQSCLYLLSKFGLWKIAAVEPSILIYCLNQSKSLPADNSAGDSEEDIEKAIANEVQSLKTSAVCDRRFQNCQTGAKNCIFIKTTIPDPSQLAHYIFSDLQKTKVQKSRHALRLLPVVGTCKASLSNITNMAEEALAPFFTDTKYEVTYHITFKARNNSGLGREMTISSLKKIITDAFPNVLTRFTPFSPKVTIMIEVMCGVCCFAVAADFSLFRKYNLLEIVSEIPKQMCTDDRKSISDKVDKLQNGASLPDIPAFNSNKDDSVAGHSAVVCQKTGEDAGQNDVRQKTGEEAGHSTICQKTEEGGHPSAEEHKSIQTFLTKEPFHLPLEPVSNAEVLDKSGTVSGSDLDVENKF